MSRKVLIIFFISACFTLAGWLVYTNNIDDYRTKAKLEAFCDSVNINSDKLQPGCGKNIRRSFKEGFEYGLITMENNETVKYYFISHHIVEGKGGTLYELPDGSTEFISGGFCCEVQIDSVYTSAESFIRDMRLYDGVIP